MESVLKSTDRVRAFELSIILIQRLAHSVKIQYGILNRYFIGGRSARIASARTRAAQVAAASWLCWVPNFSPFLGQIRPVARA